MADDRTKQALIKYVNTATDLAEAVKNNIVHEGVITDDTVLKLNAFIIAANAIEDLYNELTADNREEDESLN